MAQANAGRGQKREVAGMNKHPFDYSGASIWTRDAELKMITLGKKIGMKRREQIRQQETRIEYQCKPRKKK